MSINAMSFTYSGADLEDLQQMVCRFSHLLFEDRLDEAQPLMEAILQRQHLMGIESASLRWLEAVLADKTGDAERAYQLIEESLAMDRLSVTVMQSRRLILSHLRDSLCRVDGADTDPATPRVWKLLAEAGEADVLCHLGYATWLARAGRGEEALKVVDSVLLLNPGAAPALTTRALVLRGLGRHQEADAVAARAAGAGVTPTPFVIPAKAQA